MIVSWDWLKQYVALDMTPAELAERLMMAGLNHEDTHQVGDDWAINLEVTSNRPDCLGHIGIAREVAVLFERELKLPAALPASSGGRIAELTGVTVENPQQCPRYTARVLRGVKVAPSPRWLVSRLATVGIGAINNVVDITNYVLLECGQPLHAFDLARLNGRRIIVRQAREGETFLAINHKSYVLDASMCVIADAQRAVGLGGVMGGAETEVSPQTKELLIEAAEFDPMSIRNTARKLSLHSDSSYRFERGVDPLGVDWASRRTCELILELAGGELPEGVIDVGQQPAERQPITLRFDQLPRILGIEIDGRVARRILSALGNRELRGDARQVEVIPPSWRRDLSREIDLIEEVARIYGYDKIPEDASVPMAPSHRTETDRVLAKVRQALTAAGFDEAMTLSVVEEPWSEAFSPWTTAAPLRSSTPVLRRADRLRRSLVPSLLGARQTNESLANPVIELFEIANVYLPRGSQLPEEELVVSLTSGGDYFTVKGVIEGVLVSLNPAAELLVRPIRNDLLENKRKAQPDSQVRSISDQEFSALRHTIDTGIAALASHGRHDLFERWRRAGDLEASFIAELLFQAGFSALTAQDRQSLSLMLGGGKDDYLDLEAIRARLAALGLMDRRQLLMPLAMGEETFALTAENSSSPFVVTSARRHELLDAQQAAELWVRVAGDDELLLGYLGQVSANGLQQFELRGGATVAELNLSALAAIANLIPQYVQPPVFPSVARDLNLVVDERVLWADLAGTVRQAAAPFAESLTFQDVYRNPERLGPGKKSLLFTLTLRSPEGTLTGDQADLVCSSVVNACHAAHGAQLRA